MEWIHEEWSIKKLIELFDADKINLSPDYQRNPIWTTKAQRSLVDTILQPSPMPNFFLLRLDDGKYEMVDGQQRARTIIGFLRSQIPSSSGQTLNDIAADSDRGDAVRNYPLNITVLTELGGEESIEMFYSLVNSSGLRLNIPEIRKAKYYDTRFLELANSLATSAGFSSLGLFGSGTISRMNDIELVSELLALLKCGIGEKKTDVDRLFDNDINQDEIDTLRQAFDHVVGILCHLNDHYPISKTRYKQRADLYTVFEFISSHADLTVAAFDRYYDVLLNIDPHIRPSQEKCDPLRDYARNCVSQSHTENARKERSSFLRELLRNDTSTANGSQTAIIRFLQLPADLVEIEGAWTLDCPVVKKEDC